MKAVYYGKPAPGEDACGSCVLGNGGECRRFEQTPCDKFAEEHNLGFDRDESVFFVRDIDAPIYERSIMGNYKRMGTKDYTKKFVEVMEAYLEGADIEERAIGGEWVVTTIPLWEWGVGDYRVARNYETTNYARTRRAKFRDMNRQKFREYIDIMKAYMQGKHIQIREGGHWRDVDTPIWMLGSILYRVKPDED